MWTIRQYFSLFLRYVQCGCNALRLIVRNFSSVVRANVSAPVQTLGVDIPREERYAKCMQIHRLLLDVRAFLLKRQTLQGRLGAAFRDLHTLMQQGLDWHTVDGHYQPQTINWIFGRSLNHIMYDTAHNMQCNYILFWKFFTNL